ncbi:MAG: transcription antiterminator, partial [Streptococcus gallolyticus]|nr:transcription antiterminator [Streptococcus gallolyticus]
VEKLDDYSGIDLISKQGYGYKLDVLDDDALADFLEENHINDHHFDYQSITDINDRYNYLLNKLLFEQNEIYFDDLVDELYVSRSTLSSDFKKIRQKFKPYHLKIESKANKGVYVTGSERDKRRFIMDYFISSGFIDTMHSYVDNELLNQRISFEELTIIVLDECREGGLKLSDFVIQNLVIHIALAIRRITEGFKISKLEEEELKLRELPERQIADNILKRVSVSTGIDFPVEEVDYITLHLISKSHGNARYVSESMQERMRQELIDSIEKINPEVKNDFQLIEGLLAHLSTMLIRLEGKVVLENPLTTEIQANYQEMYQLAEQVITTMPTFQSFSLTPNEIAYIALHFMAAKERYKEQRKYNVLVICATGYGSAQMLKSRIENELGNLISITDVIGYYEINDET